MAICALATSLILAVYDFRSGKMPNWITIGSLCCGLLVRGVWGGNNGLLIAALGAAVAAAIPLGLFLFTGGRAIGGGDVKALAALGAWLGPVQGLEAEMLGFLFLAAYALSREVVVGRGGALLRRSLALVVPARWVALNEPSGAPSEMIEARFGPALFLGTLVVCAATFSLGA